MRDTRNYQVAVVRVSTQVDRRAEVFGPYSTMTHALNRLEDLRTAAESAQWTYDIVRLKQ